MRFIVGQYVLHCLVVGSDGMVQSSLEWAQWVVEVLPSLVSYQTPFTGWRLLLISLTVRRFPLV